MSFALFLPLLVAMTVTAPCIVIDPGHGGAADSGTTFETLKEKNLTLVLAQKVAEALRHTLGDTITVELTRESDVTKPIRERAQMAHNCLLLISLHINANLDPKLNGFETYYLDTLKERLPERLRDILGPQAKVPEIIVRDLEVRRLAGESGELAVRIQRQVMGRVVVLAPESRSNGARHDLFELLIRSEAPAVIVETGYLSNPDERRRLLDARYQLAIAAGVAAAVKDFLAARSTTAAR